MKDIVLNQSMILIVYVFDVGEEISLESAATVLELAPSTHRFRLRKKFNTVVINDAPLAVGLGHMQVEMGSWVFEVEVTAKIWRFGAVSILFQLKIPEGTTTEQLIELSEYLDSEDQLHNLGREKVEQLMKQLVGVIKNPELWGTFEDYVIYYLQDFKDEKMDPLALIQNDDVAALILGERKANLSQQIKDSVRSSYYQFGPKDLVCVDWNSAVVIDPTGDMELTEVLEYSCCQLLELRYYDDLLDVRLNRLYSSIENTTPGIFNNNYSRFSEEACRYYLEISEIVETVENSFKVVGDFYLAKTFRLASDRFRFKDWQGSIDNKLNNLAEVSKLLDSKVSEKRGHLMELTIIVLIFLEIIPLIWRLFLKLSK